MTNLPAPPVPATCDLRDLTWMPLDVIRLRDSDLVAVPYAEAFRVAVLSWCVSWHQVPASSLPDDDATLARLMGFGRDLRGWRRARDAGGLRGWVKHSDGRLYHPVVAEKAREAMEQQARAKTKREQDAKRLRKWRQERDGNESETSFVAERPDQTRPTVPDQTIPDRTRPTSSPPPSSAQAESRPAATAALGKRVQGVDGRRIRHGLMEGDPLELLSAYGANMGRPAAEWLRDCDGLQIGVLGAILAWRRNKRQSIREPSGLRQARIDWIGLAWKERQHWANEVSALSGQGRRSFIPVVIEQEAKS